MKQEKSCGAIILKHDCKQLQVLLLKHKAGHWAFAKGHVEGGETEEQTALREIKEETNLNVQLDTNFRATVKYSPMEDVEKEVVYFIAYKLEGNETPQLEEISQIKWLNIEESINTVTYEQDKEVLQKVEKYIKEGKDRIWKEKEDLK